jgi:lipoyl-dependent peroxiredoxin
MDKINPSFTATAKGGRNGHTAASDGSVGVDLSVPKAMGGPGKPNTSTPEHLFACGYAACFGGALDCVRKLHIEDTTLPQAELATLVNKAHEKVCPYSHATRNNVEVQFEVIGG